MEPTTKQNLTKRFRRDDDEEPLLPDVRKIRIMGPREPNAIPAPNASTDLELKEVMKDPKIPADQRRHLHVFYKSLVDCGKYKPTIVRELDEDWPFDENMDPSLAEAWRPMMDQPLLPFVIGLRDFIRK